MRVARRAALLACAAAVAYLLIFLFGPVYTRCEIPAIGPGTTPGPGTCTSEGWLAMTLSQAGPFDPRPLFFLGAWTVAPFVALAGTRLPPSYRAIGLALVLAGFLIDATSIISMGGGFVYALLCGPLLLIAFVSMLVALIGERMG